MEEKNKFYLQKQIILFNHCYIFRLRVCVMYHLWQGRGLLDGVHGELPDILLRVEDDDVELGAVQAEQGHVGAQADRHTQCRHLNLKTLFLNLKTIYTLYTRGVLNSTVLPSFLSGLIGNKRE